jgi:hypothetical protein
MRIKPSQAQIDLAVSHGVEYQDGRVKRHEPRKKQEKGKIVDYIDIYWSDLFLDFFRECLKNRVADSEENLAKKLESVDRESQYSFSEMKPLKSALMSDLHYFERVQYLRLSRKNMSLKGIKLYTCSETSRLADWFPYSSVENVCDKYELGVDQQSTVGLYTGRKLEIDIPFHRDIKPYGNQDRTQQQQQNQNKVVNVEPKKEIEKGIYDKLVELEMNNPSIKETL